MKDVEKFQELLFEFEKVVLTNGMVKEYVEVKKQLIKMYEELEEPKEKPVIKCKEYEVNYIGEENCIGQMQDRYEIHWQGKSCWQSITSETIIEKDSSLITDDFIFVKEVI